MPSILRQRSSAGGLPIVRPGWSRAFNGIALWFVASVALLNASETEVGAPLVRAFKPRDYLGSPAVARVLPHPATGELLMLAGTFLHIYNGATWTAVQTDTPAPR